MPAQMQPGWRVTGQVERLQATPDGKVVSGVVVSFTTAGGHSGTVFVPDTLYDPAHVAQAVQARAAVMDQVGQLAG